jgi:phospholipase/carboxylesterase
VSSVAWRGIELNDHEGKTVKTLDGPRWGPASGGAPRQLVVLAHGLGADGHDLIDLGPYWGKALPHALFVAPNAPEQNAASAFGRQWFALWDRKPEQLAAGVAVAAAGLLGFVEAELARLGLPAEQVALMGFSQGAMVSLHAGLRRKMPPRAILAYAGALLAPTLPPLPAPPPVLLVHGEADDLVPAAASAQAADTLRAAGVKVELLTVPRLGHGIDDIGLSAGALFLQRAFGQDGA